MSCGPVPAPPVTTFWPALGDAGLVVRVHRVRRRPRGHHRARIHPLLPTWSAGVRLYEVFLPGRRRPTAAVPPLRPKVTSPMVRYRATIELGEVTTFVLPGVTE